MKHNGFKYRYRQKMIARSVIANRRIKNFPFISTVKTIGLMADCKLNMQSISTFFQHDVKFSTLQFASEKRQKNDESTVIFSNDLNFWGLPPQIMIKEFTEQHFDLLINLLPSPFDPADYASACANAGLKIALYEKDEVYDLIISLREPDTKTYINEIVKTLKSFSQ